MSIPEIFECPECGKRAVTYLPVHMGEEASCSECGYEEKFP